MHTEIVAYYGGGGGSGWGGGGLALNPGAVSWEERRACCTLCTRQNSQEFGFFRKTSHILFLCTEHKLLHYCLFHLYNIFTTLTPSLKQPTSTISVLARLQSQFKAKI